MSSSPPKPWTWQCHRCQHHWRLGATRRCLTCHHTYCSILTDEPGKEIVIDELAGAKQGYCSAHFDFSFWKENNATLRHRRDKREGKRVALPDHFGSSRVTRSSTPDSWEEDYDDDGEEEKGKEESERQRLRREENKRVERIELGRGSCDIDCNWPGECMSIKYEYGLRRMECDESGGSEEVRVEDERHRVREDMMTDDAEDDETLYASSDDMDVDGEAGSSA